VDTIFCQTCFAIRPVLPDFTVTVRPLFVNIVPTTATRVLAVFPAYPAMRVISEFSTARRTGAWLWRAT